MDEELRALLETQTRLIAELTERLRPAVPVITFGELYTRYEKAHCKRSSWATIAFALRRSSAAWEAREAMSLCPSDWTALRATHKEKGLSDTTLNQDLMWSKAVLNWAVREKLIPSNPLANCRRVKIAKPHRETAPTEDENLALLAACERQEERVLILSAADAGMRNGEGRKLEWSWLDRERMEIRLPNAICKNKRGGTVPMTGRLLEAIEAMPRRLGSPYVLPNPKGEPYSTVTVCAWIRGVRRRAGVRGAPGEEVTLHSLRHGWGTNAAERGVGIETIQDVYRHASLDQTRSYIQRRPRDLARAREAFEAGIKRGR